MRTLVAGILLTSWLASAQPVAQRIAHTDPALYRPSPSVHGGPGQLNYMALFDGRNRNSLPSLMAPKNLIFLHRGIIQPKSGIGHHFHNRCEEMFVIFDAEAQFTIDGRTSVLKAPAGAPTRAGSCKPKNGIASPSALNRNQPANGIPIPAMAASSSETPITPRDTARIVAPAQTCRWC